MSLHFTTYPNATAFLAKVEHVLLPQEVTHSLILGLALQLKQTPDAYLTVLTATVEDEQGLLVSALMTPPFNLILHAHRALNQDALALCIQSIRQLQWPVPGVTSPANVASDFVQIWQQQTGQTATLIEQERVFELTEVNHPPAAPGTIRPVTDEDTELITRWYHDFMEEALPTENREGMKERAIARIKQKQFYLWETPDGQAVSFAGKTRPIVHVISIGPVYTPPEQRGHGYASNLVAALSQHLLDSGWQKCSLFTNLANPISNSIYQKMGYRPVVDFHRYNFQL
ncbi:MAG TPA: GNAT family N-acetyltransferase [Dictyobacter sp.]|jgi:predicted GNAT family acetyltransferase|nr:GNAT family N-acetyltransferase [Dictyobacter sp.]